MFLNRPVLMLIVSSLALVIAGCDDDTTRPGNGGGTGGTAGTWTEVDLGILLGTSSSLGSIDCGGDDCIALGASYSTFRSDVLPDYTSIFYQLQSDGSWLPATLEGIRSDTWADLALDTTGAPVVVGFGFNGATYSASLYDGRTEPPAIIQQSPGGLLTVDGDGDFFVAGGSFGASGLWTSTVKPQWTQDVLPLTFKRDTGFRDVYVRGNKAVACGFDDGADTLAVVLERTTTTNWTHVNRNGLPFAPSLRCIALSETGAIYVAGIAEAGGSNERAFAAIRSTQGEWISAVLPDAVSLGGVNDILIASDDSVYLACSGEYEFSTAHIIRVSNSGIKSEITPFVGKLNQLAEGSDGTIYAVGERRVGVGPNTERILLVRD